ncbi:MAG: UDP-N-acetylglucosamine 2-epimerase (non-hydrolyzing) [Firmicutes bacterium]|nr:UDP-N-acetylglucosamine 2-epimerase (non-hydrolyzing) [Bacillota bacterium]
MKVATVAGTRPQFIKAALVSRALRKSNSEIFIHTGQHYDYNLSGIFFADQDLPVPDYRLIAGPGAPGLQLSKMLEGLGAVLAREKPDLVIVYGDCRTTLAGGLAAARAGIPLAHVEAGLRSRNPSMAEEYNRVVADHLSAVLLCPSESAVRNLEDEGFTGIVNKGKLITMSDIRMLPKERCVVNVGDVLCSALLEYLNSGRQPPAVPGHPSLRPGEYLLATVHRAENTDNRERLASILKNLASAGEKVVLPLHPRTLKKIREFGLDGYLRCPGLIITEPVGHLEMIRLIKTARKVITDSGGVQKEAFILKVPCITLREETEWVETVERGCNVLVGCDRRLFREALAATPDGDWSGFPYGRGDAVRLIVRVLECYCCSG